MKRLLTSVVIVTALTVSAFAEGDPTGSEAIGEANGSAKASTQNLAALQSLSGGGTMAQAKIQRTKGKGHDAMASAKIKGDAKAKGESSQASAGGKVSTGGGVFSPLGSGMDGGNRK